MKANTKKMYMVPETDILSLEPRHALMEASAFGKNDAVEPEMMHAPSRDLIYID